MPDSLRHGEVFDGIAEAYDARRSGYPSEIVAAAVELADLGPGSRVVEVGSGTGKLTEELVACGLRVDAVEPGRNMVAVARRRLDDSDQVRFHIGRFEDVAAPRRSVRRGLFGVGIPLGRPASRLGEGCRAAASGRDRRSAAADQRPRRGRRQALDELREAFARLAPESPPSGPLSATRQRSARGPRRDARMCRRSGPGSPIPVSGSRRQAGSSGRRRSPPSRASPSKRPTSCGRSSRRPRSTTVSPHAVRTELRAEDERIIERHGGTLRSSRLVALVTARRL